MNQNEKRMILTSVQKPGRYAGGEYGQVIKDRAAVSARFAFCFPDTYEIGMSNLGVRILYHCLNLHERIWCERVYDPWVDMQEKMKEYDLPLTAVESGDPLSVFDFIGFTLQYEMSYTNVLNMLELGRVPIWARERGEHDPLVIGGGPCSYNPEPVADFFDLFNIGEGEEMLPEIVELYIAMRDEGSYTRAAFLHRAAATIPGVYVPSLYDVTYNEDGTPDAMNAAWGGISDDQELSMCISAEHKTTANILARKAFTVSMATADQMAACDYVGIESGNQVANKLEKAGWHTTPSEFVDAPLIDELPMAVECRLVSYDPESCRLVGEIVNISADESVLGEDGRVDPDKLRPITFDPIHNAYRILGEKVGNAFRDGAKLK